MEFSPKLPSAFLHLDHSQEQLSDTIVGLVRPRAPRARNHIDLEESKTLLKKTTSSDVPSIVTKDSLLSLAGPFQDKAATRSTLPSLTGMKRTAPEADTNIPRKRIGISRREQCRANQARYRIRQRNHQLELEENVRRLRQDVADLKQRHEDVLSNGRSKQSPWAIVAEVFRLLDESLRTPWRIIDASETMNDAKTQRNLMFLLECFSPDVAMDDFSGVNALIKQLQRFSLVFGDSDLLLQRVESTAPGVVTATATLCVTVTELTMRNAFPNLSKGQPRYADGGRVALRERLQGQILSCSYTMTFLFDEETGRVERLGVNIDLVGPLLRVLGGLEEVTSALLGTNCSIAL